MDSKYIYDFIIKIQAIAKIGLTYSKDPYAITNYNEINDLSKKFLEDFENVKIDRPNYFSKDIYPTPNISVRTVILNKYRTKVMMVRESALGTYSLPGGWADLYDSPSRTAKNECSQEAGADIEVVRLVGVLDRTPFKSSASIPEYVAPIAAPVVAPAIPPLSIIPPAVWAKSLPNLSATNLPVNSLALLNSLNPLTALKAKPTAPPDAINVGSTAPPTSQPDVPIKP